MKALLTGVLALAVAVPAAGQSVRVTETLAVLESRARTDSNDAAVHYNLAMGYWSKKKYEEAEASLRSAITIEPQFAEAHLALSIVRNWDEDYWRRLRRQGGDTLILSKAKEWGRSYRQAFLLNPLVDLKILGATFQLGGYHGHFWDGLENLVEGRYDKAFEHFTEELNDAQGRNPIDSVSERLVWFHGLAAAHVNKYAEAAADYSHLLIRVTREIDRDSTDEVPLKANDYRYMLAVLNHRMGRFDEALELYRQVLENDLGNFMAHVQQARIHEGVQQWDLAITERRRAVETNPDDASLLLDLGITLGRAGQFALALESLEQSREMNPRDARTLFWIGTAAFQLKQNDRAREAFTDFIASASSRYQSQIAMARQRLSEIP